MKAKEMFEELGYEQNDYSNDKNYKNETYANYVYEIRKEPHKPSKDIFYNQKVLFKEIAFYPNLKKVEMYYNEDFDENYGIRNVYQCLWSLEELKAIQKQVEELGWLD